MKMENHKLWLIDNDATKDAVEVQGIDFNKATIIYLSGVGDFMFDWVSYPLRRSLVDIVGSCDVNHNKYNLYTITGKKLRDPEDLIDSIEEFNKNPTKNKTEGAELYNLIMEKHVPDSSENSEIQKNNIEAIKKKFSTINFIGHSYGAVFLGQIQNALHSDMRHKGYMEDEIEACASSLLGCYIGPSRKLDDRVIGIPSLYAVSYHDPYPDMRGNYRELVKDDPHEVLAHGMYGKALIVYSRESDYTLPTIALKRITNEEPKPYKERVFRRRFSIEELKELDEEIRHKAIRDKDKPLFSERRYRSQNGKFSPVPQWKLEVKYRHVDDDDGDGGHHPFRYTNTNKQRNDLEKYVFQVEPMAHIVCQLIEDQLKSSIDCIENNTSRNGLSILSKIIEQELSTEGKQRAIDNIEQAKKNFDEIYTKSPNYIKSQDFSR